MTLLIHNAGFYELVVFSRVLLQEGHTVIFSPSPQETCHIIANSKIDLLITCEDSLPCFDSIFADQPGLNLALIATSHRPYHIVNEKHDILMKLPNMPEKSDALMLIKKLSNTHTSLPAEA